MALGNPKSALRAYLQAHRTNPEHIGVAHALGALLDTYKNRPQDALIYLAQANRAAPENSKFAASYAHALARIGDFGLAKQVLGRTMGKGSARTQQMLWRWIEKLAQLEQRARKAAPYPADVEKKRIKRRSTRERVKPS